MLIGPCMIPSAVVSSRTSGKSMYNVLGIRSLNQYLAPILILHERYTDLGVLGSVHVVKDLNV